MEAAATITRPAGMGRWEWILLTAAVGLCVALALISRGKADKHAYTRFLAAAPKIQAALEAYAADHQGRFPPDAMATNPPQGLHPDYIWWSRGWAVDYEVHPNGKGGKFVCLEFLGPLRQKLYQGLCRKPELRRRYGRGQPIPGTMNRIWVIRESAPIMPRRPPDKKDQGG